MVYLICRWQAQLEKQKRLTDAAQLKATESEQKITALKKELDALSQRNKQSGQEGQAKDVRLLSSAFTKLSEF